MNRQISRVLFNYENSPEWTRSSCQSARGTQNLKGRLAAVLVTTELTGHSVVRCKAIRGYRAHVRTNSFPRAGVRLEND